MPSRTTGGLCARSSVGRVNSWLQRFPAQYCQGAWDGASGRDVLKRQLEVWEKSWEKQECPQERGTLFRKRWILQRNSKRSNFQKDPKHLCINPKGWGLWATAWLGCQARPVLGPGVCAAAFTLSLSFWTGRMQPCGWPGICQGPWNWQGGGGGGCLWCEKHMTSSGSPIAVSSVIIS